MADYKGLTIRIGGDTSKLTSALNASRSAASSLERQLRQVRNIMRIDPSSMAGLTTGVKLASDRMSSLQSKVTLLKSAYDELGKEIVNVNGHATSVEKLSQSTDNVAQKAAEAKAEFNELTAQLARTYQRFSEMGKLATGKDWNLHDAFRKNNNIDLTDQLNELVKVGAITRQDADAAMLLRERFNEAQQTLSAFTKASQFDALAIDIERTEADVTALIAEMRELDSTSKLSRTFDSTKLRQYDAALESVGETFEQYDRALRNNPQSYEAAVGRASALKQQIELSAEKARELGSRLKEYKAAGVDEIIAKHRNLAMWVEEVKHNYDEANKKLSEAKGRLSAYEQSLERINRLRAGDTDISGLTKQEREIARDEKAYKELETQIERTKEEIIDLDMAQKKAAADYDTAKMCTEAQQLETEIEGLASEAEHARRSLDKIGNGNGSMFNASTLKSLGMTLYSTVTPAVSMLGYRAVSAADSIDSAYRNMRKTVEGTEEQFKALRDGAVEFSKTHVVSADQLLEIEAVGGELGIATENLETFATVVSNISTASNYEAEDAATMLGQLANITHMTAEEYEGFSDALVRLGNNGASTETQIGDIATRIGSMSTIVGMSIPDMLAWASTLASTGQKVESVSTAFTKTMSLMETSVAAAGGTIDTSFEAINAAVAEGGDQLTVFASLAGMTADEFAEAWTTDAESVFGELQSNLEGAKGSLQMIADVAHMSAEEFAQAWESDPTEALRAFIEGLNDIEGAGGSADAVLENLGIKSARQKQAIEGLMQTIGLLGDNITMSNDAWAGMTDRWGQSGDAANEAAKKAEGFSGQLQILKNIGNNALAELAEGAVPWMKMLSDLAGKASESLSEMGEGTKAALVGGLAIAGGAGPMLTFAATIATAKQNIKDYLDKTSVMGRVAKKFKAELAGMKSAADSSAAGFGTITTSVNASGDAMAKNTGKFSKFKTVAGGLGASLLKGLAVGAIIAAGVAVVASIMSIVKQMERLRKAGENSGDILASALGRTTEKVKAQTRATFDSYNELIDHVVESNDKLRDSAKETWQNVGMSERYAETISDALKKVEEGGSLTSREMSELKNAVEGYNEVTGESITITETEDGKISVLKDDVELTADAFDRLSQSKEAAMKAEWFRESESEYYGSFMEAEEKAREAKKELDAALEKSRYDSLDEFKQHVEEGWDLTAEEQAILALLNDYEKLNGEAVTLKGNMEGAAAAAEFFEYVEQGIQSGNLSDFAKALYENDDAVLALVSNGQDVLDFATKIEGLGLSAEQLASVDIEKMADSWDGSIASIIPFLEEMGVKLDDDTAKALGLDKIKIGNKTFYVDDDGSIVDETGQLQEFDEKELREKGFTVDDEGTIRDAEGKVADLDSIKLATKPLKVKGDLTPVITYVESVTSLLAGISDKDIKVNASGDAFNKIANLVTTLNTITSKIFNVKVTGTRSATGSVADSPFIPKHAAGYIATGPTLTNNGWVGEAGAEAVLNWGTGGTVIPLTNRRYMVPIAREIAAEMDSLGGGKTVNVNVSLNYSAGSDANQMAADLTRALRRKILMEG